MRMLSHEYHILSFTVDASRVGACQIRHRLFCVGVRAGDDRVLAEFERLIPELKTTQRTAPRTAVHDVLPELRDRSVFVYPRGVDDPCVFEARGCLPTLRRMTIFRPSACLNNAPAHWTVGLRDHRPEAAVVLTPEMMARASGFPAGFFTFASRQKCRWGLALGNTVPPPVQEYVMGIVARVVVFAGEGGVGSYNHAEYALTRR